MRIFPVTNSSDSVAVDGTSRQFAPTMADGQTWRYCASVATWIAQSANPTATAADGSMFVPAGVEILIDGGAGAKLAVIQDSVGGVATLTQVYQP